MKIFIKTTLLLLVLLLPASAAAYDFEVDGIYYNINGSEATVTYKQQYVAEYYGDVTIPDVVTYNGTTYSVTTIGNNAFSGCGGLTSVSIPNSVTVIGNKAFTLCSGLTSLIIPNSVTSIGEQAFAYCSGLTSVTIPESVTIIGYFVFNGCSGLTSVSIPNTVTAIDDGAFKGCSGLTSVSIPNSVTRIGYHAFSGCSGVTSISIPNTVTFIGDGAFSYCGGLTSLNVENGNTTYDSRENCNAIIVTASNKMIAACQNTVIPNSVTSISYAFAGCSGLTSISIPNSVTTIDNEAFAGCSGLTSVTIPNSVIRIGWSAFQDCSGLTNIDIPNSVVTIDVGAFKSCSGLTGVTIPNSVTTIGSNAFADCRGLTSVTIPNSVTSISGGMFAGCSGLTSVNIPNSITIIGVEAFAYCSGLTSVSIPNSVTRLGKEAFTDCTGLTAVAIPNSVTEIGDKAFAYCESLANVTIPNSVTTIGDKAFAYCQSLMDVNCYIIEPFKVTIGEDLFYVWTENDFFDYSGRTLHVPHGTANVYQTGDHWWPYFGQIVEDLMPSNSWVSFTGIEEFQVIEVTPDASTGLDRIYVVYNTNGVGMNYHSASGEQPVWYIFGSAGGDNAEEIPGISWDGSTATLSQVVPNAGYKIVDGDDTHYYWIVNYADHYLELNDLSITNESPCDLLKLNVDGQGDFIIYSTVNGNQQVLDREIKLTYNTLEWNDTNCWWQELNIDESYVALWNGGFIVPPLRHTCFRLSGDRFLEEWGIGEVVGSEYFYTQAVDCRSTVVAPNYDALIDISGELSGMAPLQILFSGYPTDAVAHRVWEMATDPDFENIILQFNQDEVDYTFNDAGTFYLRYKVANEAGTCEAYGETHIITVSGRLQGDVNRDGRVDIADVNSVIDVIQGYCNNTDADVNSDGEVTIADINAVIDIILNSSEVP